MKKPSKSLLNQLINQGKAHAETNLRGDGCVPPVLFGHTTDGEFMLMPPKFDEVPNKNEFALIARLHCLAHETKGVAFVSEVWVAPESPDELPDTPPCESVNPDYEHRSQTAGAAGFFAKPLDLPKFVARLKKLIA